MIAPDVAHVWRLGLDLTPQLAQVFDDVLSPAERARRDGYADRTVRRRFLAVYGSLRVILGAYRGEPPSRVPLRTGRWGKPLLGDDGLRFNISHSGRCALLAVSAERDIGVDVERARRDRSVEAFARRYFPPAEARLVAAAPPAERTALHLTLWTRKEACVKAAGDRLLNGLDLPVAGPDGLLVHRPGGRIPGPWRVRDLRVPPGYRGSVALAGTEPFDVEYRHCRPVDLARALTGASGRSTRALPSAAW
ncbi:4'-phosphopantetheinyl transferase superfamily protein [Micromonospora sp. WMMD1082]|uniref:4'-phosphopantetheinyl transferase family protein n=1 Tax=Micromonospora sp. WMMD1082 TaxID=3016104 RepID=UPI002415AA07|nr:4'-phosphopantetheinyl transferase superfamily protein [Micromonospora sp. WMMD1082]MDG4792811.1 4'-phosphopantetheinyl transferase superfamily protein [Micromonospora sp. WMMD1082]